MNRPYWVFSAIACALLLHPSARAQLGNNPQLKAAFADTGAKASQSTVRVVSGRKDIALGVIVGADGWILTKHSVLPGPKVTCRLPGGKELEAVLHAHNVPNDLALLKVETADLTPIELVDSTCSIAGHWVVSPNQNNQLVALGVLSVAAREVKGAKFQLIGPPVGYLGLSVNVEHAGVKIANVFPNTPAEKAGLKADDIVVKVGGNAFESSDEFLAFMASQKPGTVVPFRIDRGDGEIDINVKIGPRPEAGGKSMIDKTNNMGSKLSERRGGFPVILTHDGVIKPEDCGGPLVNLDGKALGINIARAGRTESYAIPSEVVRPLLERLKGGEKNDNKNEKK